MIQDTSKNSSSSTPAALSTLSTSSSESHSTQPRSKWSRVRDSLKAFFCSWYFPMIVMSVFVLSGSLTSVIFFNTVERGFVRKLDRHIDKRIKQHQQHQQPLQYPPASLIETNQLATQLSALSDQFIEAQSHQQALENFYTALMHDRERLTLREIEQTLSTVNEQLPLTGNVSLALSALENADTRLAAFDSARSKTARDAIAHDLAALQAMPTVNFAELASALDHAYQQVDTLPLAGDTAIVHTATTATTANATESDVTSPASWKTALKHFSHDITNQLRSLVQVRRLDNADIMRIAPDQSTLLRENLKLRLLSARLSLLLQHPEISIADLKIADTVITRYFDLAAPPTQMVHNLIQRIEQMPTNLKLPNLNTSLQALRQSEADSKVHNEAKNDS